MEFLYLPRLDLRDPHDSRITDTVAVVEAMLSRRTPNGTAYYRYGVDGHGEWIDCSGWPRRHFGIGRPWPLLAGERGHYDVRRWRRQRPAPGDARNAGPGRSAPRAGLGHQPTAPGDNCGTVSRPAARCRWPGHSKLIKLAVTAATGRPVEML